MRMLAIGAGGLEISMALTGQPFRLRMPEIWGIRLTGRLPDWVSAKDVILEILRRHNVDGGRGRIIEYYGPGVAELASMDRQVIANMGVEVSAVTTIFPSDQETRRYLAAQGREEDWRPLAAEGNAVYDIDEELDLSALEPLLPSSPGNVAPVREVEGQEIYQAYSDPRPIPAIAMPRWLRRWLRAGGSLRASRSTSTRLRAKRSSS
jgi:aconitate hydratase